MSAFSVGDKVSFRVPYLSGRAKASGRLAWAHGVIVSHGLYPRTWRIEFTQSWSKKIQTTTLQGKQLKKRFS